MLEDLIVVTVFKVIDRIIEAQQGGPPLTEEEISEFRGLRENAEDRIQALADRIRAGGSPQGQ